MCNGGHGGEAAARARAVKAGSAFRPGAPPRVARALARLATLALAAAALFAPPAGAAGADGPRIVWAGEGRVYVAAPDSGSLAPLALVRVFEKGREIAAGEVASVLDGVLASVVLTSGRIEPDARFDRLEVRLESAPARAVATLRVGLPAPGRQGLAPPCASSRLDPGALPRAYRSEPLAGGGVRLVAADSVALATRWPDTLLVRTFGDRADEEIALERGELDVAVFWPGEPSARLRASAPGFELLRGVRARGLLVAREDRAAERPRAALAARLRPPMSDLNAELFAGDLLPWRERSAAAAAESAAAPPAGLGLLRYRVDAALPGAPAIGRFLNRGLGAARAGGGTVFVGYEGVAVATRDSLEAAGAGGPAIPLFALRCPVIFPSARADDVRALGADAFANLLQCLPVRKRP